MGEIAPEKLVVAPGMCRMGCGTVVAKGADGRNFDTCCKGCACGKSHSGTCSGSVTAAPPKKIAAGDASVTAAPPKKIAAGDSVKAPLPKKVAGSDSVKAQLPRKEGASDSVKAQLPRKEGASDSVKS